MSNQQISIKFAKEQGNLTTRQMDALGKFCVENDLLYYEHKHGIGNYVVTISPKT